MDFRIHHQPQANQRRRFRAQRKGHPVQRQGVEDKRRFQVAEE